MEASSPPSPAASTGSKPVSWRDRVDQVGEADEPPEVSPPRPVACEPATSAPAPPVPAIRRATEPLAAFRDGLPARVRAHVDQGLICAEEDGLALLLPAGREGSVQDLEEQRFHLMGAAAAAFGRPVPVLLRVDEGLLRRSPSEGELAGSELTERRNLEAATEHPSVQAVLKRFEGRVTSVGEPGRSAI